MNDKIGTGLVGVGFIAWFSYVLYSGWTERVLSFKGQNFPRDEKPVFYWALMFMAAFMVFAGVAGLLSIFGK